MTLLESSPKLSKSLKKKIAKKNLVIISKALKEMEESDIFCLPEALMVEIDGEYLTLEDFKDIEMNITEWM